MVATTVVTTAIAGSTPTVVIANPANTHLSLPIGKNFFYIFFLYHIYNTRMEVIPGVSAENFESIAVRGTNCRAFEIRVKGIF